jgi:hypothetical protein
MSSVQIYLKAQDGSDPEWIANIEGGLIARYSKLIRDMIAEWEEPQLVYRIVLDGPDFYSAKFVLEAVVEAAVNDLPLKIALGPRGITQAVKIHRAIKCLIIEPEQTAFVAKLQNLLAKTLVTRTQLLMVWAAYSMPGNAHAKLCETMIQTTAFKVVNDDKIKPGQKTQLFEAAQSQPALFNVLDAKINTLKESKRVREIIEAKNAAKKEKQRRAIMEARHLAEEQRVAAEEQRRAQAEELERARAEAWDGFASGAAGW